MKSELHLRISHRLSSWLKGRSAVFEDQRPLRLCRRQGHVISNPLALLPGPNKIECPTSLSNAALVDREDGASVGDTLTLMYNVRKFHALVIGSVSLAVVVLFMSLKTEVVSVGALQTIVAFWSDV